MDVLGNHQASLLLSREWIHSWCTRITSDMLHTGGICIASRGVIYKERHWESCFVTAIWNIRASCEIRSPNLSYREALKHICPSIYFQETFESPTLYYQRENSETKRQGYIITLYRNNIYGDINLIKGPSTEGLTTELISGEPKIFQVEQLSKGRRDWACNR